MKVSVEIDVAELRSVAIDAMRQAIKDEIHRMVHHDLFVQVGLVKPRLMAEIHAAINSDELVKAVDDEFFQFIKANRKTLIEYALKGRDQRIQSAIKATLETTVQSLIDEATLRKRRRRKNKSSRR